MSDDVLLPTDAEMDSRRHVRANKADDDGGDWIGAPVIPDTLKRAEWAIKRLEKRAKERALPSAPQQGNPEP